MDRALAVAVTVQGMEQVLIVTSFASARRKQVRSPGQYPNLMVNPMSDFGDRFEAVMTDMLRGNHVTQIEPEDPGLYREPVDNDEDENPTHDF